MVWRGEDINAPFRLYTHRQMIPLHQTASYSPGSTHSHHSLCPPLPLQWCAPFSMMVGGWGDRMLSVFPSREMFMAGGWGDRMLSVFPSREMLMVGGWGDRMLSVFPSHEMLMVVAPFWWSCCHSPLPPPSQSLTRSKSPVPPHFPTPT